MTDQSYLDRLSYRGLALLLAAWLGIVAWGGIKTIAAEQAPKSTSGPGAAAAVALSEKGTILRRGGTDAHTWQVVSQKDKLHVGDFLVGLPGAMLESPDGTVHLDFLADLDRLSPYPIRECAVQLGAKTKPDDLEVTLDRGRMDLVNRKAKGAAQVRVHVRNDVFDLILAEPGARVALELFGRWPRGVPFSKEPSPKQMPVASLLILALEGEATLKHERHEHALKAPPGPALVEWDSITGMDETPRRLEKLPPWAGARGEDTPEGKQRKAALERLRQALASKPIDTVADEFLNSESPVDRGLAVNLLAAVDDLSRLGQALRQTKYPDVWESGVVALRNWIGRCPGQDQILYKRLLEVGKYKPVHAETIMQLLHSFGDIELAQPETYQTLIDYLDHDSYAICGLAYWHLSRLVPEGKKFGYNPSDSKEKREAAIQQWQQLIPKGRVPQRPKEDGGNGR